MNSISIVGLSSWSTPATMLSHRSASYLASWPTQQVKKSDAATLLINSHGCQIGLSCGLLALNHVLRSLIPAATPVMLAMFAAVNGDTAGENFDLLDLLTFAQSAGLGAEPLPARRPRAAYLLHSPGHFLALTPTRLGYLLCDSLQSLPYILTAVEQENLLNLFHSMQLQSAHANLHDPNRAAQWTGICLFRRGRD